jgi:hypothetical protein
MLRDQALGQSAIISVEQVVGLIAGSLPLMDMTGTSAELQEMITIMTKRQPR